MAETARVEPENPETTYEQQDWPMDWVGYIYIGIFVFLVITPFILIAAYPRSVSDVSRRLLSPPLSPQLQVDPARDYLLFNAHEERLLRTYYWVDKQKGIVHIPIEQAIKKLAAQGIDGFPKAGQ
jgi:hypothetical protein